jgi:hypothetical protein
VGAVKPGLCEEHSSSCELKGNKISRVSETSCPHVSREMRKNIGGTASAALALLNAENIYNGGILKCVQLLVIAEKCWIMIYLRNVLIKRFQEDLTIQE